MKTLFLVLTVQIMKSLCMLLYAVNHAFVAYILNRAYLIKENNKSQAMHTMQDMFQNKNKPDLDILYTWLYERSLTSQR